jgi:hypothetical protein
MEISIAELQAAGIQLEAVEAVAIAQQLIDALRGSHANDEVEPPYGPPSAETVFLKSDGTVACRGCGTTPAVSEIGIFLHSLLRQESAKVSGGLRYTIARALLDVDAPPFDSLEDFSRDLARHERGGRPEIVRRLLRRAGGQRTAIAAAPPFDRRRARTSSMSTTELRRALRDAEMRLYETQDDQPYQLQVKPMSVIDQLPEAPKPAPEHRTLTAVAGLAAGIALICTGELMHKRTEPMVVTPPPAPLTAQYPTPATPVPPEVPLDRGLIAVRDVPSVSTAVSRPEVERVSVKRTKRPPAPTAHRSSAPRPRSRGVLDRLRLGWLRSAFGSRSSL